LNQWGQLSGSFGSLDGVGISLRSKAKRFEVSKKGLFRMPPQEITTHTVFPSTSSCKVPSAPPARVTSPASPPFSTAHTPPPQGVGIHQPAIGQNQGRAQLTMLNLRAELVLLYARQKHRHSVAVKRYDMKVWELWRARGTTRGSTSYSCPAKLLSRRFEWGWRSRVSGGGACARAVKVGGGGAVGRCCPAAGLASRAPRPCSRGPLGWSSLRTRRGRRTKPGKH